MTNLSHPKKNQTTQIQLLSRGDRFYFVTDKKKTVFQVVEHKTERYKYGVLSTVISVPGSSHPYRHVKKGREVVFLRNVNEIPKGII